jgi:hypothetical protein
MGIERKHSKIRDSLLVEVGENPSYNFQDEYQASLSEGGDHHAHMSELRTEIGEAKNRIEAERIYAEKQRAEEAKLQQNKLDDVLKFDDIDEIEVVLEDAVESNVTLLDFTDDNVQ